MGSPPARHFDSAVIVLVVVQNLIDTTHIFIDGMRASVATMEGGDADAEEKSSWVCWILH